MTSIRGPSLKERLRAAGFRATPARLNIATLLEEAHHPLATPVLIKKFVPHLLDLATLYRTLKSFEEKSLIKRLSFDERHASYEWIHEGDHHHHLVCERCGCIEEIPECHLELLEKRILKDSVQFVALNSHSLEFFGVCRACQG